MSRSGVTPQCVEQLRQRVLDGEEEGVGDLGVVERVVGRAAAARPGRAGRRGRRLPADVPPGRNRGRRSAARRRSDERGAGVHRLRRTPARGGTAPGQAPRTGRPRRAAGTRRGRRPLTRWPSRVLGGGAQPAAASAGVSATRARRWSSRRARSGGCGRGRPGVPAVGAGPADGRVAVLAQRRGRRPADRGSTCVAAG